MSQLDKLIQRILRMDPHLRFAELEKVLLRFHYQKNTPGRGGNHHTFRKDNRNPITIPKKNPVKKAYIELVQQAILMELTEEEIEEE